MVNAFSNIQLNKSKATLPTNESWFNSHNIVKDPPKSIYTRRKAKVDPVEYRNFEEDKSRLNESISKYTRGKNLMVPVSYNNGTGGKQAYLKNTHDTYRYEVETPKDTLPLSRTAIGNREIHTAKAATNLTFENSNVLDKNKVLTNDNINLEKHSVKSNESIGDHKSLIDLNNPKLNDNKVLFNMLSNKKSFQNYLKQHPELVNSGITYNMLLYNLLSNKRNYEYEERELIDSKTGKLNENVSMIDYTTGKSYNLDELTNNIDIERLLNDDKISIDISTTKSRALQKLFDEIMLEEGKITNNNILRTIHTRKSKTIDQDPNTQVDHKRVRITDKNVSVSLPPNRTYLKETSENRMIKVDDHVSDKVTKIEKTTDKQYYTKNNMELVKNLNHNLRSEEDMIFQKKDIKSVKTKQGGREYISNANSSQKKLMLPSLDRGGSFAPTPQGVATSNINQEPHSIINRNNGGLRRNLGFF